MGRVQRAMLQRVSDACGYSLSTVSAGSPSGKVGSTYEFHCAMRRGIAIVVAILIEG